MVLVGGSGNVPDVQEVYAVGMPAEPQQSSAHAAMQPEQLQHPAAAMAAFQQQHPAAAMAALQQQDPAAAMATFQQQFGHTLPLPQQLQPTALQMPAMQHVPHLNTNVAGSGYMAPAVSTFAAQMMQMLSSSSISSTMQQMQTGVMVGGMMGGMMAGLMGSMMPPGPPATTAPQRQLDRRPAIVSSTLQLSA